MDSYAMFSYGLLHMDTPVLTEQQKLTFTISMQILLAVKKTYQQQWPIATDDERELFIDDDDDDDG